MDYFIELNSQYFFNNIAVIKNITNCIIAPVVKSNAYGHGIKEIIGLLNKYEQIKQVCVAYVDEAMKVRSVGWQNKIIIMSAIRDIIEIDENFQYFIYSFDFLFFLLKKAAENNIVFEVHIKLNCGMNRFGFNSSEINELIELLIKNAAYIKVVGIATHLPRLNYVYSEEIACQISIFNSIAKRLQEFFGDDLLLHPFSSKGMNLIQKTNASCNMVRVGGAIYGLLNNEQAKTLMQENSRNKLQQILTLKAKVVAVREVKKNEYVGYGEAYRVKKDSVIAIASFGYGYGYNISLLEAPVTAWCNNQYLSFCGLIGMNALFFDVSGFSCSVEPGDIIILTSEEHNDIKAPNLSNKYIGKRDYVFTTMLHESICKIVL
jgi:alanine racemase